MCFLLGAGGGIYGYMQKASLPSLLAGLTFGALYGVSASWIRSGRLLDGVDLSIRNGLGYLRMFY